MQCSRGGCEHGRRPEAGHIISRRGSIGGIGIGAPAEGEIEDVIMKKGPFFLFCLLFRLNKPLL
jgi:hypothetical protein